MPASSGRSGKNRPGGRRRPTGRAEPASAERRPTTPAPADRRPPGQPGPPDDHAEFFEPILTACAPIAELGTAFDVELAVSALLGGAFAAADSEREAAVSRFSDDLVAVLRARTGTLPVTLLAGLSGVAPGASAARAGDALAASDQALRPAWADLVGAAESTGAWAMSDVYGDQTEYILTFRYADAELGGPPHAVCVLADHNLGVVKDCWVSTAPDEVLAECRRSAGSDDGLVLAEADPALVRAVLTVQFAGTDALPELPSSQQLSEERCVVLRRVGTLPEGGELPVPPGPDERAALVDEFLASPQVKRLDGPDTDVVLACAQLLVDYPADRGRSDPLTWSPLAVEVFLADWAPRSAVIDAECVRWLPVVLDTFLSWAGERRGLPASAVSASRGAVTEHAGEFAEAMARGARNAATAAQIARQLIADGVDPTDEKAVRAWLDAR